MEIIAESEGRFTAPTARCPRPDLWSSTDDHSTEVEVSELLAGLVRGLQPYLCIETGTAWGQTAEAIGKALLANGHGRLYTYELDGSRVESALRRVEGLPVSVYHRWSLEADLTLFASHTQIDFAFFDSDFPSRLPEFHHFRKWMTDRTIVAFHDTAFQAGGGQFPHGDLRANIQWELVDTGLLRVIDLPTPRGLTIGQVL